MSPELEESNPQPQQPDPDSPLPEMIISKGVGLPDAVQAILHGNVEGDLVLGNKVYMRSDLEELNEYLTKAVFAFESQMYQALRRPSKPNHPYKFLQPFTVEDGPIFFGRTEAVDELYQKVIDNRVTVLYARSGAGKTSILNAGLSPQLIAEARLPVFVHIHPYEENPVRAIKLAIVSSTLGPWPKLLPELSLQEFLGLVCARLSRDTRELVVMFDQFEQFLVTLPESKVRLPFIKALGECYDDQTLPIRFIIALRQENLADLDELEQFIPSILLNRYRLLPMSESEVRAAITGPIAGKGKEVSMEPALLDALLKRLATKDTELTHLQIVCTKLYDSLPEGETVLTLSLYTSLGEVEGIITNYLDDSLSLLPDYKQLVARTILKALVSSRATNRILRLPELMAVIPPEASQVDAVLQYLIDKRLLRQEDTLEGKEYELAHAYLAEKIIHWVSQEELANKSAQELLQRELASMRVYRSTTVDEDKLNILREHVKYLVLDQDAQQLLMESALEYGHDVTFWLEQVTDKQDALEKLVTRLQVVPRELLDKMLADLTTRLQPPLRDRLLSLVWSLYKKPGNLSQKQPLADALWAFGSRLSPKDKIQILPVVTLGWARRRKQLVILGAALVLLLSVLGGIIMSRERAIPGKWVTIDAGDFTMGMDEEERKFAFALCDKEALKNDDGSSPCTLLEELVIESGEQKDAWLPDYQIMDNEVTNAQYQQCVEAGGCNPPADWSYEAKLMNRPVVRLTWSQAGEYCGWLGVPPPVGDMPTGRLPTEGEWEKAARGPMNYRFPWGNDWIASNANIKHKNESTVQSIDALDDTDISGYGVKNLAGNVQEWTATEAQYITPGQMFSNIPFEWEDDGGDNPFDQPAVIVRGGSWQSEPSLGMAAKRGAYGAKDKHEAIGFRCVCTRVDACKEPWNGLWILKSILSDQ